MVAGMHRGGHGGNISMRAQAVPVASPMAPVAVLWDADHCISPHRPASCCAPLPQDNNTIYLQRVPAFKDAGISVQASAVGRMAGRQERCSASLACCWGGQCCPGYTLGDAGNRHVEMEAGGEEQKRHAGC